MIILIKMQELIDALVEFFKTLPLWGKIALLPILLFAYWLAKSIGSSKKSQINLLIVIKKFIANISRKDLHSNFLFVNLELYKNKIKSLSFNDENKDFIFKTILQCKIVAIEDKLKRFLDRKDIYKLCTKDLSVELIRLTDDIIQEYDLNIRKKIKERYLTKDYNAIYELVMNSESGFNNHHSKNVQTIYMYIGKISNSILYLDDNYEKISMYFDMVDMAIQTALLDVETVFKAFNGRFSKLMK